MKILITADYFLPSKRASGPIRSLINFVQKYSGEHELYLVTRDRDSNAKQPFEDVVRNEWNELCGIRAYYLEPEDVGGDKLAQLIRSVKPDSIYMNSLFSPLTRSVLGFARRRSIPDSDLLVAVRGELNPGALAIKPIRKQIFLRAARRLGLFKSVRFQASSDEERRFIEKWFRANPIHIAMNIPEKVYAEPKHRPSGRCRYIFNSRLSPIKNLEVVLRAFEQLIGNQQGFDAILEIHGAPADPAYVAKIEGMARRCGGQAKLCGPYAHDRIWSILETASFTVLPSRGENFAHAIYESAAAGVPFLVSDRTPWTEAARSGAGWVIDPDDLACWKKALIESFEISSDSYRSASSKCVDAAKHVQSLAHRQHDALFSCH